MNTQSAGVGPTLTRGEYWILESVTWLCYGLPSIASPDVNEICNKPGHGLTRKQLAITFVSLFERKWIDAHIGEGESFFPSDVDEIEGMFDCRRIEGYEKMSTEDQFLADLKFIQNEVVYYGLTDEGAKQWERFAFPNWSCYLDKQIGVGPEDGPETAEITCQQKWMAERFLEHASTIGHVIDESTVEWDVISPWEATYWKTLPKGHRLRYKFTDDRKDWSDVPADMMDLMGNRLWYRWQ